MTAMIGPDEDARQERTGLGNYFVANYPPFSRCPRCPPLRLTPA